MGLVKLIGQMVQLLTDQCNQTKDLTSVLQAQAQHTEEMASVLKEIQQAQADQKWFYEAIAAQVQAIELRTSKRMCSPVDAIRHIAQDACGDIWGLDQECFQVAAQLFQTQGIFTRGQLPVMADITRGQFYAAQEILARHQLLAEKPEWQPGVVAFALPCIQSKLIQASGNQLTRERIDEVLGINQAIRQELNDAIARAPPRFKMGDQDPVPPQDPDYARQIHEMLPKHTVTKLFQDSFPRT